MTRPGLSNRTPNGVSDCHPVPSSRGDNGVTAGCHVLAPDPVPITPLNLTFRNALRARRAELWITDRRALTDRPAQKIGKDRRTTPRGVTPGARRTVVALVVAGWITANAWTVHTAWQVWT